LQHCSLVTRYNAANAKGCPRGAATTLILVVSTSRASEDKHPPIAVTPVETFNHCLPAIGWKSCEANLNGRVQLFSRVLHGFKLATNYRTGGV